MTRDERLGLLLVALAVGLFSTSPVLIRWAAPLSPYEITAWRLGVAALVVMSLARLKRQPLGPPRRDLRRFLGFGLITALHFLFYIASLNFTTIAHSLALVYTAPIFVTIASAWFLHEPIPRRKWLGVIVAIIGIAILTGFEPQMTGRMIVGDLLAIGSAVMFGLYSVAGRSQRTQYPLFTYAGAVYGLAALWMLPIAALTFTPSGYGWRQAGSLLSLGVLPLGLGHTLYNAALRRVHATYVNLIATQEVTGGVILGILLLHEIPSLNAIIGAIVTLIGIAFVIV
ncbi:MAG TPA: DMT family transporter [Caldilineae bacterium]|nr:DMT family transporter [Caldilineae bacterium]